MKERRPQRKMQTMVTGYKKPLENITYDAEKEEKPEVIQRKGHWQIVRAMKNVKPHYINNLRAYSFGARVEIPELPPTALKELGLTDQQDAQRRANAIVNMKAIQHVEQLRNLWYEHRRLFKEKDSLRRREKSQEAELAKWKRIAGKYGLGSKKKSVKAK